MNNNKLSNTSIFMVMLGFTFFSASMWAGQNLAAGLDFKGFILALLLGGTILAAYTGSLGFIGAGCRWMNWRARVSEAAAACCPAP